MQIEKFNEKKLQKEIEEFEKGSKKIFISTDDTTVCWRIWGKGQPIIFLHGGYGSWRHWIKQVTYLSKDYQILVPDMPGFGESSDLKSDHTPETPSQTKNQDPARPTNQGGPSRPPSGFETIESNFKKSFILFVSGFWAWCLPLLW